MKIQSSYTYAEALRVIARLNNLSKGGFSNLKTGCVESLVEFQDLDGNDHTLHLSYDTLNDTLTATKTKAKNLLLHHVGLRKPSASSPEVAHLSGELYDYLTEVGFNLFELGLLPDVENLAVRCSTSVIYVFCKPPGSTYRLVSTYLKLPETGYNQAIEVLSNLMRNTMSMNPSLLGSQFKLTNFKGFGAVQAYIPWKVVSKLPVGRPNLIQTGSLSAQAVSEVEPSHTPSAQAVPEAKSSLEERVEALERKLEALKQALGDSNDHE